MANIISNRFLTNLGEAGIDLENDVIRVALMLNTYTENKDTNTWVNTFETSGTNYVAGGELLATSLVTQDDSGDLAKWDADDVEWAASTITAQYAVVYDTTVADTILIVIDFGTDQSSNNGMFAVRWNASGIMTSAQA